MSLPARLPLARSLVARALTPLGPVAQTVAAHAKSWAQQSQLHARRNAMVAATRLAARRAEIDEVEQFLSDLGPAPAAEPDETTRSAARA